MKPHDGLTAAERRRPSLGARLTRLAIAGALATATVALAGSAAAGGAALEERSSTADVAVGETTEQVARCKRRSRFVAAGFDSPADLAGFDGPFNLTHTSQRKGKRAHRTAAHNLGGTAGPHTALVYCAKRGYKLRQRSATVEIPALAGLGAGASATATARCPRRHQVVSGGFTLPDANTAELDVFVHESRRAGKFAWSVSAANTTESTKKLTAFAYCKRGKPKLKEYSMSGTIEAFANPVVGVTINCLPGERAISWGFRSTSFGFTASERALPLSAQRVSPGAWVVEAVRKGLLGEDFTAYVYCR